MRSFFLLPSNHHWSLTLSLSERYRGWLTLTTVQNTLWEDTMIPVVSTLCWARYFLQKSFVSPEKHFSLRVPLLSFHYLADMRSSCLLYASREWSPRNPKTSTERLRRWQSDRGGNSKPESQYCMINETPDYRENVKGGTESSLGTKTMFLEEMLPCCVLKAENELFRRDEKFRL